MEKSTLGEIIRFYRKRRKVSQSDLCRKICSVPRISRIENGEIEIPMMLAQALLGRLGVNVNRFELFLNEKDYQLYRQRSSVEKALREENPFQAEKELIKYEKIMDNDKLNWQYVKLEKAKIILLKIRRSEGDSQLSSERKCLEEKAERLLRKAAEYTIPEFSESEDILLCRVEIEILLTKVRQYYMENLERVHNYIKKYYSMELKEEMYPRVQLELAKMQVEMGNEQQALLEIDEAMKVIASGRSYRYCADLHFLYAQILAKLCLNRKDWKEKREECIDRCLQAYYLYEFDADDSAKEVEKYLREVLQWECTVSGM